MPRYLYRVEVRPKPRGGEPWIGHFTSERKAREWGEGWSPDEYTIVMARYAMAKWPRLRGGQHKSDAPGDKHG